MSAALCAVCYRRARVEGSAKCFECSSGQIAVPQPLRSEPLTRFERAVLMLDPDDEDNVAQLSESEQSA